MKYFACKWKTLIDKKVLIKEIAYFFISILKNCLTSKN